MPQNFNGHYSSVLDVMIGHKHMPDHPIHQIRRGATSNAKAATQAFDIDTLRADFPILTSSITETFLSFISTALEQQKPVQVLDAMDLTTDQSIPMFIVAS